MSADMPCREVRVRSLDGERDGSPYAAVREGEGPSNCRELFRRLPVGRVQGTVQHEALMLEVGEQLAPPLQ